MEECCDVAEVLFDDQVTIDMSECILENSCEVTLGAAQELFRYLPGFDCVIPFGKVFVFAQGELVELLIGNFDSSGVSSFI